MRNWIVTLYVLFASQTLFAVPIISNIGIPAIPVSANHYLSGYVNEQGNSGNSGLHGHVLVRSLNTSADFDFTNKKWWASVSMSGDFLDNPAVTANDIQFALANPRHASSDKDLLVVHEGQNEWGSYYESEFIFGVSISATSQLFKTDMLGILSQTDTWVNLKNGLVTDKHMRISTYLWPGPRPYWAQDWDAYASFSGVIIPEPATMVILSIGSLLTLRRRRR